MPTIMFENDVKEYGFQTKEHIHQPEAAFENDVKEYGFQTKTRSHEVIYSLRMM